MSIHIGSVPLSQNSTDVFTIYSTKSNVMKLASPGNHVFMDIGDYNFGQRLSNEPFVFSYKNNNIITYDSNNISFHRDIVAACNLNIIGSFKTSADLVCRNLITSNLVIENPSLNGNKFIDCTSNNIDTFYLINNDNGIGYIGGRFGVGVIPNDKNYSLMTSSNIYVNGDICGERVVVDRIFSKNTITIDSPRVIVNNLQLGGQNVFTNLQSSDIADMKGLFLASNVNIYNNLTTRNPFKINQRLINDRYGDPTTGNPISVRSQHQNIVEHPTIFELSSCGNLILGDYPSTQIQATNNITIISDYVIRGNIPLDRERHFKGYLSFSANGLEKTLFNVNKIGQVSIGSSRPSAILDIANNFTGSETNYVKPSSIIHLRNKNSSNVLPFLKCENSNFAKFFQITSNATICFNETPENIDLYNIESDTNLFSNIDTCKISSYSSDGIIDMSYTILSNLNNVISENIDTETLSVQNINAVDCYIKNLEVESFSSYGLDVSPTLFEVQSDSLAVSGKNIIISKDTNPELLPDYANIDTDKLIIKTETSQLNANGYTIYGTNKSITLLCKNESVSANTYVAQELQNGEIEGRGFGIVSKITSPNDPPELYITPIIQNGAGRYDNPAIALYYDSSTVFNGDVSVKLDGIPAGFTRKSLNSGNGLLVLSPSDEDTRQYICLTTNMYGSLDTGRGIGTTLKGGPFNKQGGWQEISSTGCIISHIDYGVRENTAGTIFIQVRGTSKIGSASLSFLRFAGEPNLFTISTHKSPNLIVLKVTAHTNGIKVEADSGCQVCWTSIGSC